MKRIIAFLLGITPFFLHAQTNVRAWYADGQVWVVWTYAQPLAETYAVYAKPTVFNNTDNATLVGRLFPHEYLPGALREQVDSTANYRIPDGQGGIYELADNEALFVATPHQSGALFFAVVRYGQTAVTPGVNITAGAVPFQYNPSGDPVECHLQRGFISPFDQDYVCLAFYMWADGRQNQWENRPDFPVMANAAKNGMPSFFLISAPIGLDTTQKLPLSVWLHGGGGTARQSLAGSRQDVHLNPQKGILLAHNDDLVGYYLATYVGLGGVSKHFGWRKNYDPFTGAPAVGIDTIVNYTLRRYRWIDDWLARNFNIDTTRININGHSMGSRGTTMMAKVYPDHYATATVFNNSGLEDDPPAPSDVAFGTSADNFPSNLRTYEGEIIPFTHAMDYNTRLSPQRDMPLMRYFHSKNDTNGGNSWDADLVQNFRTADSLGWGAQLFWSERSHGIDTGLDYNDHWVSGWPATQQTIIDDIAYEETHYRSDVSFPAFFNHRLDPQSNDPGDGTPGTGPQAPGDDWGTWGGWHRWDWDNITDTPDKWSAVAWLESNAVFDHDNCPFDVLTADLAIRKPRQFKPQTGKQIKWAVIDTNTGAILQSGFTVVQADNLVVIPQVQVYREAVRKVRILISDPSVAAYEPENEASLRVWPNPVRNELFLPENPGFIRIFDVNGVLVQEINDTQQERVELGHLPAGLYFLQTANGRGRFVKA